MANNLVTLNDVGGVLEEIEQAFYDIPFENSDFQTKAFVVAAQITPARAYRAIGLRMFSKIQAVKEYQFNREMTAIDIEEKEAKIADPATSEFDKRRLRLEIIKAQDNAKWGEKLANDALHDLNLMYAELKKYPQYTREMFEAEEEKHFEARLTRQLQAPGVHESIVNMRTDLPEFDARIEIFAKAPLEKKD